MWQLGLICRGLGKIIELALQIILIMTLIINVRAPLAPHNIITNILIYSYNNTLVLAITKRLIRIPHGNNNKCKRIKLINVSPKR